jgi:hypothetical protein
MLRCAFLLGVRGVDIARVNNLVADIGKENHPFSIFFRLLDEGFSPQARCFTISSESAYVLGNTQRQKPQQQFFFECPHGCLVSFCLMFIVKFRLIFEKETLQDASGCVLIGLA